METSRHNLYREQLLTQLSPHVYYTTNHILSIKDEHYVIYDFILFSNIICDFSQERECRTIELAEADPCPEPIHLFTFRVQGYCRLHKHRKYSSLKISK